MTENYLVRFTKDLCYRQKMHFFTKTFTGKPVKNSFGTCLSFLHRLRSFSWTGLYNFFSLKLRRKSIVVMGSCRSCGSCCQNICLEGRNGWLRSESAFAKVVIKYPEYGRFEAVGKNAQGFLLFSCSWFTPQGTCRDYDNRLPLCANFPESSLVFAGGQLPVNCGYRFTEVVPFAKILHQEMNRKK